MMWSNRTDKPMPINPPIEFFIGVSIGVFFGNGLYFPVVQCGLISAVGTIAMPYRILWCGFFSSISNF